MSLGERSEITRWVPLSKEVFPQGSLGYSIFPDVLEGRLRPETTFSQPLGSLWNRASSSPSLLNMQGFLSVGEILRRSEEELREITLGKASKATEIRGRLEAYLQGLIITPHGKLLAEIFGGGEVPVPAEFEQEQVDAVNAVLGDPARKLRDMEEKVIFLKFGLVNGITRKPTEISDIFKLSDSRINKITQIAFRRLRHPSRSKFLKGYLAVPERSLARQEFGIVFQKDLLDVNG